ncbi:YopX family protein [Proteiniclasticum sp. QWL-01]|uniref:YopX family protein n=1 Tax=Proteiniclasticum sp. QWL-01 TaxID=3036945 RepID=UPI002411637D|nr:YopX family protein [Proteiniclasticum sp. QWL-01]WFF74000.1 YopX family protein [Proteiniclasticum sp. QWL-01]
MELKFRAWVKPENKYLPIASIDFFNEEITVWGCGYENCGLCDDHYPMDDVILEQYLGFDDKNGRKIFVGDFVKVKDGLRFGDQYECVGTILVEDIRSIGSGDYYEMEVIGNIHEDPELMEVKE